MADFVDYREPRGDRKPAMGGLLKIAGFVAVCFLALLLVLAVVLYSEDNAAIGRRNEAKGQQIVQALEQYKAAKGAYPPTLDALVPMYIGRIPRPDSAEWLYLPDPGGAEFGLFFEGGANDPVSSYNSKDKYWNTDTK